MSGESTTPDAVEFTRRLYKTVSIQTGRPVSSSGDVQIRFAAVHTWAEGLIVRITTYGDVDEARAAAERLAESRG
jgi:hypothetical protein